MRHEMKTAEFNQSIKTHLLSATCRKPIRAQDDRRTCLVLSNVAKYCYSLTIFSIAKQPGTKFPRKFGFRKHDNFFPPATLYTRRCPTSSANVSFYFIY